MLIGPRRGSSRDARRWVSGQARAAGLPHQAVAVAELLTSELVANAVVHAGGDVAVDLRVSTEQLTVAVTDHSEDVPVVRSTGPEVMGGHGLRLVDRLASRWGVERCRGGKTVWFTVAADAHL